MNLSVGVIGSSHGWEQLLLQEGVAFRRIEAGSDPSAFSVCVLARSPSAREREFLQEHLSGGGGVLAYAGHFAGIAGTSVLPTRIRYLHPGAGEVTFPAGLVDLDMAGAIAKEASHLRTDRNVFAVQAGPLSGGSVVLLPFDAGVAIVDTRSASRLFPTPSRRFSVERVSRVGKGEIRHLVHSALVFLHHARSLPYVHSWHFPGEAKGIFALRIDTDGAPRRDVDRLYEISLEHHTPFSWFVDVKSHESWLSRFGAMEGQEIGVHCYEHRVYRTYGENYASLQRARSLLGLVGVQARGFSAPYGIWHPVLAQAAHDVGFEYSSEFAFAYDTLPLRPPGPEIMPPPLQVPVHPICPGTLRRAGLTERHMAEYYSWVTDTKLRRGEPLFFYHHPSHRAWDVVRMVLDDAMAKGARPTTMGEYAGWWKRRILAPPAARCVDGRVILDAQPEAPPGLAVRIIAPGGAELMARPSCEISLGTLRGAARQPYGPPEDARRAREFHLRPALASIHAWMVRAVG